MTITILKLDAGQTIPRPYNRASTVEEMVEIVAVHLSVENAKARGLNLRDQQRAADDYHSQVKFIVAKNLDTERPIVATGRTTFYAFREA